MTSSQLKTQIDTDITNKVSSNTITTTNVGVNTKAVVDYVDQEKNSLSLSLSDVAFTGNYNDITNAIIKTNLVNITQSQILQLFTTPVVILDSTDSGIARIPLNIVVKRNSIGTNYTFATNQFSLLSNNNSSYSISLSNSILTGPFPISYVNFSANANTQIATSLDTETYKLGAYTSNPSGGTGGIYVYVTYIEITL